MASENVTVIGLQWGDEGKGKIIDALARSSRYVVRFCGGANAGHTVKVGDETFAMHLIPCGILSDGVMNIVGNGVAFDPVVALEEIDALRERNVAVGPENLRISGSAHLVMPWHKQADVLNEQSLSAGRRIGTTARGIGPCYADKASRSTAIRVGELLDAEQFRQKVRYIADVKSRTFAALYQADPLDGDAIAAEYLDCAERLRAMIDNTGAILRAAIAEGQRIFFEGAQGSMLDVDHGTYPFVTSSGVTACGVASGAGVPPSAVGQIVGLVKAYTTRVGAGPFPTEQDNDTGRFLRERGNEYGTTTGRPRRCGWFDAAAVRYAADISGVDELALSLLDVLSGLDSVRICTGYQADGADLPDFDPSVLHNVQCVYETLPGWRRDISNCRKFSDLPSEAQDYVRTVEQVVGRPVGFISVGAERAQTIIHNTRIEGLG